MSDTPGDHNDESFPELVSRIVDDAKEVARAEIALVRAQVGARVGGLLDRYRAAAILFLVAALLGVAASIGLIVGLLLILAAWVGPALATLVVVGGAAAVAGLLGWLGLRRLKRA